MQKADKIGRVVAERLSQAAEKWGNKDAQMWKYSRNFVQFLGVNALNT
jgi:hypothetical protein